MTKDVFCHDKHVCFIATKMILVAAPASDDRYERGCDQVKRGQSVDLLHSTVSAHNML